MEKLLLILLILVLIIIILSRSSKKIVIDGIRYKLNTWKKTAEVLSNDYSGDIVIPPTISYLNDGNTYQVTSIGHRAFQNCSGMTSINIPNTVKSIGHCAFYGCSGLTSVVY